MHEIAEQVMAWQQEGLDVAVARIVRLGGMSSRRPDDALAATADGSRDGRVGRLLSGAADEQVLPLLQQTAADGTARVVAIEIGDPQAVAAGLACGGRATLLLQPASQVDGAVWERLARREPVTLVTDLADGATTTADDGTEHPDDVRRIAAQGLTQTTTVEHDGRTLLVTADHPPCRLLVLGEGSLAQALHDVGAVLGWETTAVPDTDEQAALAATAALGAGDAVVVLSHDIAVSSAVLASALDQGVGYVGGLGSRGTQAKRREWLRQNGTDDASADAVRGPAGLDVGARTPAEIAVAVAAEVLAVRTGSAGGPLRDRPGPVHRRD